MATQRVSITAAFSEAWGRMTTILFRPFDLGKWLTVGFTAWLAGLTSSGGGNGGFSAPGTPEAPQDLEEVVAGASSAVRESLESGVRWLLENPVWLVAGIFGCGLLIALLLVFLWLSSRGKFMFLDNVVHDRAEVVAPWKRYRRLANSHFFFQLAFYLAVIVFVLGSLLAALAFGGLAWSTDLGAPLSCLLLAVGVPLFLVLVLAIAYVQYFLDAFVVPLMYRYDLPVLMAWSRFAEILRTHPGALLLSGLFVFVLALAAGIAVVVTGCFTCCLGFLLLMIPYVGTVVLLPIPVTYRAFTVALLDQIDPGYFAPDDLGAA